MLVELGVVEQRYRAVLEVLEEGLPVTEVARRYGVARQTVHEWLSRYVGGGLAGLAGRGHAAAGPVGGLPGPAENPVTGCWPGCRCCTPTGCARPRD
jgi:transposase-like protein